MLDLTQSNFSRNTTSFSATLPLPNSGPPDTTTRVGSPPVCESITLIAALPSQSPQFPPEHHPSNSYTPASLPRLYLHTSHTTSSPARQTPDPPQIPNPLPSAALSNF